MRRPVRTAAIGLLTCALMAGCSYLPGARTETCIDWVRFGTPQEQFEQAGLVLVGKPVGEDGETNIYGYLARIHLVEAESVLKGETGPEPLRIASMPVTCSGGTSYPDGDPLDGNQRMLIYANQQDGYWFTMTPAQGRSSDRSG
ncbi:MAG: hypothetical protein JWO49_454 [Arthrobacter sp.]|nr:hypothetical protein [Arthrobacter sp.]